MLSAMNSLFYPGDLPGLLAVAAMLGLRHGFDADHLAAIDGMTRFNIAERPALARRTGFWFSIGHGAVVMVVAIGIATMASAWQAPGWLEPFGAWTSIGVLLMLGGLNLVAVRRTPAHHVVTPVGWRASLFSRLQRAAGRGAIMGVGAVFAISFDTLSQAALMAATGAASRGLPAVIALTSAFVAGMLLTDGLQGWWVAHLVRRSGRTAAQASRVMCGTLASISLGTAALGIATQLSSTVESWASERESMFGLVIVGMVTVGFLAGSLKARRNRVIS